jgi:diacylglycerol kinase
MKPFIKVVISSLFLLTAAALINSAIVAYVYPFLYNEVNSITKRGDDMDDDIDFVNTFIMFMLWTCLLTALLFFIKLGTNNKIVTFIPLKR